MEIIQELAEQLGVAAENLLSAYAPYYLGRTIGAATLALVMFIIMTIVGIVSLYMSFKARTDTYEGVAFAVALIAGMILLGSLIALSVTIPNAIGAIMSPQGAAIADIVSKVTGVA